MFTYVPGILQTANKKQNAEIMSAFETLRVQIDGYVATVTLCNGKANAMSSKFFSECKEVRFFEGVCKGLFSACLK